MLRTLIADHWARLASFSVIGALVFVLNIAVQALFVQVWHVKPVVSYICVGVGAIQLNFALNRRFTWRDRQVSCWKACYRFNLQKFVSAGFNILLFAGIVRLGANYLVANVVTTGVFTVVNYAAGHSWAFAAGRRGKLPSR